MASSYLDIVPYEESTPFHFGTYQTDFFFFWGGDDFVVPPPLGRQIRCACGVT